jgi:hypothetical protein
MFNDTSNDPVVLQKPYKILMSFLDRADYGEKILNAVVVDMLTSMYRQCLRDAKKSAVVRPNP